MSSSYNNTAVPNNSCLAPQTMVASVMPPIMIIEFLLGLPATMVALWIFCRHLVAWRTNTVYLFNLVLADFLLLASLPFRIYTLFNNEHWIFGEPFCRILMFMLATNRSASVAFMTIVAVDRYFRVVHPHHRANRLTMQRAVAIAGLVWMVVVTLRVPLLTTKLLNKQGESLFCRSFNNDADSTPEMKLHYTLFIAEIILPALLLAFCSSRIALILRRCRLDKAHKVRRAIRVVLVIVVVFTVCFIPSLVFGFITLLVQKLWPDDCKVFQLLGELFIISLGFTYLNSALDPLIYCFSSDMFRNALKVSLNRSGLCHQANQRSNMSFLQRS